MKASLRIPVAVKIGAYFSSLPNAARRLDQAGADALVLFNRFYQPDFDLENLEVVPNLILSTPHELLLRLNWVAVLYGKIQADLAVTGGVHTGLDVLKSMMAGARVAMMTSALLKNGIGHLATRAGGTSEMDGGTRVRIHPADARQHEPAGRGRPFSLPAGELRQGAQLVFSEGGGEVRPNLIRISRFEFTTHSQTSERGARSYPTSRGIAPRLFILHINKHVDVYHA